MAVWSRVRKSELASDFRLDAEYYRPLFLALDERLEEMGATPWGELPGRFVVGPFGSAFDTANYVEQSPYRYIRGRDVKPFFLLDDDNVYLSKTHFNALSKYRVFQGDLLISVVGTLGNCALVTADVGEAVFSCKSTAFRPTEDDVDFPYFLVAYLNSKVGVSFVERLPRGAVQTGLNLDDLKRIPIARPPHNVLASIAARVRGAEKARAKAKALLVEAETQMAATLGLSNLNSNPKLSYSRKFSDLQAANRFGAEYFMPCKQRVLDALAGEPGRLLGEHYCSVRSLFAPRTARRGEQVRNFDLTDALDPVLDDRMAPMPAEEVGSTKKKFQFGDIVISRLRSYLREIALVRTSHGVPAVGSSEFIVLRPREGAGGKLTPETLLIYLRSLPVQTILKWSQDGSQHPRFNVDDLLAIPVPASVVRIVPKVDALVNEALAARDASARLLEEAKAEVERMVLGNMK